MNPYLLSGAFVDSCSCVVSDTTVQARLAQLERQNRWLIRALGGLVVFAGLGVFVGAAQERNRTVTVEKLVVIDAKGNRQAVLEGKPAGPSLTFYNGNGKPCAEFSVTGEGPALGLESPRGESVSVSATRQSTGMAVTNTKTEIAAALGVTKHGPDFILRDDQGKTLFHKP